MKKVILLLIFVWTLGMSNACLAVAELSEDEYRQWVKTQYFGMKEYSVAKDGIHVHSIVFSRKASDFSSPCYIDAISRGLRGYQIPPGPCWLVFDDEDVVELKQVRHDKGQLDSVGFHNDVGLYRVPVEAAEKIQQTKQVKIRFLRFGIYMEIKFPEGYVERCREVIDWKEPEQAKKAS